MQIQNTLGIEWEEERLERALFPPGQIAAKPLERAEPDWARTLGFQNSGSSVKYRTELLKRA